MEMKTQRDSMILRCHLYTDIFCIYYFIAPHLLQKGSKYDRETFQLLLLQLQSHQGWARIEARLIHFLCVISVGKSYKPMPFYKLTKTESYIVLTLL